MPFSYSTIVKKIDEVPNDINKKLVYQFLDHMQYLTNSEHHQINNLKIIIEFSKYFESDITFYDINRKEQILSFLKTKVKSQEEDPDKKWITNWNNYLNRIRLFLRWLHNTHNQERSNNNITNNNNNYSYPLEWNTPDFLKIKLLKTKRISPYFESELWERDELLSIVKYESYKRNKAILTLLWDLNARPHEITLLRIKHIRLREKYGEGEIPHEAKTGSGPILLACSFPYVRDWLNEHPFRNEPDSRLICDLRTGNKIRPDAINDIMKLLKKRIIRLLENGEINNKDEREKLEYLLKSKKWNPYCIRHSSITADSDYLPEYALKKKVRWSMNSRQGSRYIKKRMGNELKEKILEQNGIVIDKSSTKKPTIIECPRCQLVCAVENKFCSKCSYPLTIEAYDEVKETDTNIIENMQKQIQSLVQSQNEILECLKYPEKLAQIALER